MTNFKTEQEKFWNGEFGDAYIERNNSTELLATNVGFWTPIISRTENLNSVIELGSNIGMNLKAIKRLKPNISFSAVEINHKAAEILKGDSDFADAQVKVYEQSILDYECKETYDLAFTKGVLIHINPDEVATVYRKLYDSSKRYVCIAEYYNPSPVQISYRGSSDRLFKRDFAGEFMDLYPDFKLVDYGFVYHRDNNWKADDITWFLMEKR